MSKADIAAEARRWRMYAEEDLSTAIEMAKGELGTPRHACWLAQQAAEKAIKSILILHQLEYPKSHDLDRLRSLLPDSARHCIQTIDLAELSHWAVESRYPGEWPELGYPDALRAVESAEAVVNGLSQFID